MKLSKELKVGLLALVGGVIFYVGLNFLKGSDLLSSTRRYYILYNDVDGLTVSNAVMLNGLSVGRVKTIRMLPDRQNELLVAIEIDANITVGDCTQAVLTDSDLLGSKTIVLDIGRGSRTLKSEDTLIAAKAKGISEILQERAVPVLNNLDSMTLVLNEIINEFKGTATQIGSTMNNFERTSEVLQFTVAENRGSIGSTMRNLDQLTNSLVETEKQIGPLLGKMNRLADTLNEAEIAAAVNNANASIQNLNQILARVNEGEGSLGKLATDDGLYNNLERTTADLDLLLRDLRQDPRHYLPPLIQIGKGREGRQAARQEKREAQAPGKKIEMEIQPGDTTRPQSRLP